MNNIKKFLEVNVRVGMGKLDLQEKEAKIYRQMQERTRNKKIDLRRGQRGALKVKDSNRLIVETQANSMSIICLNCLNSRDTGQFIEYYIYTLKGIY